MADLLHIAQLDEAIGKQSQRPAGLALRARTARKGNEMGFLLSIEGMGSCLGMKAMVECIVQAVVYEALADADHRVTAHLEGFGHLFIGPARTRGMAIDLQKDTGMRLLSRGRFACSKQLL